MPWKDRYTISDEKSLADGDIRWPDGRRCAIHIVVDLSVASGPEGILTRDIENPAAEFGAHEGLDLVLATLEKYKLKATFAVPAVTAKMYACFSASKKEPGSTALRKSSPRSPDASRLVGSPCLGRRIPSQAVPSA